MAKMQIIFTYHHRANTLKILIGFKLIDIKLVKLSEPIDLKNK